jgi:hypothetical protein
MNSGALAGGTLGHLVRGGTQRPGELRYRSGTIWDPYFLFVQEL